MPLRHVRDIVEVEAFAGVVQVEGRWEDALESEVRGIISQGHINLVWYQGHCACPG